LWAKIKKEDTTFLAYSCHFRVADQGMLERKKMISEIAENSRRFPGPVIICGDMNTVIPDKKSHRGIVRLWHRFPNPDSKEFGDLAERNERYFFLDTVHKYGYEELGDMTKNTWRDVFTGRELFDLKLDWMLYRNCKGVSSCLGDWIGDHKAIIGELLLK